MTKSDADDLGPWAEFGRAVENVSTVAARGPEGTTGFGPNPDAPDLDGLPAVTGFGAAPAQTDLFGEQAGAALRDAAEGLDKARVDAVPGSPAPAPAGYHNRVDANGDGHLDHATYRGDGHGGAEILVDLNHDGQPDFVGYDTDLDNRVDYADFDKDHDGIFEKRMYDDNNDGILDRTVWLHGHDS